jgi:hypothetical protein
VAHRRRHRPGGRPAADHRRLALTNLDVTIHCSTQPPKGN